MGKDNMTRINVVPVYTLTDKHLLAEYKEITRPFNKVIDRIAKYGEKDALRGVEMPTQYVLGKGHESFFFDKLCWLFFRYNDLYEELLERNFNMDRDKYEEITRMLFTKLRNTPYWNSYQPTPEEMYLNFSRLVKRCKIKEVQDEIRAK